MVGARTTRGPRPAGADDRGRAPVQVGSRAPRQRAHRATTVAGHADLFPGRPAVVAALLGPAGSRGARAGPGRAGQSAITLAEIPRWRAIASPARRPGRQSPPRAARPRLDGDLLQHRT